MENTDFIYGKNAIIEALTSGKREINKILISKNIHTDTKIEKIKELAQANGIVYQFVGKDKFANHNEYNHQGVIAMISPIKYTDLDDFIETHTENASLVVLDGVEDVHNIGAIIRTCVCAGIDGIMITSRRNSPITSVVEKTSAGAVNHIPIIKVNSLSSSIQKLQKHNWWVIATDADSKDTCYDISYSDMNYVLIMGAEHAGVSKSLLKMSDYKVKIPMLKDFNSLNVSAATAIIVFEAVRQRLQNRRENQ